MDKTGKQALIFGLCLLLGSCYYDKKEDLYGTPAACNPSNVSFSADVKPIFTTYCVSCHNASLMSGNIRLDTYEGAQQSASNGRLVGAINHSPGFSPMPQGGGKLPECDIKKISKWVEEGIRNN